MDVLGRVYQLKADALAMTACREAPAFYDRDLVRHVGMLRVVGDAVHAALGNNLARLELLRHGGSYRYIDLLWQQAGGQRCSAAAATYPPRHPMFWSRDEPSATIKSGVSDPIDETVLDGLRQDFASRIIRLYLDGTPGVLKELRAAARVGDMSALHTANHNLLSASATLGAVRLAALCHDMDLVLKAADR